MVSSKGKLDEGPAWTLQAGDVLLPPQTGT